MTSTYDASGLHTDKPHAMRTYSGRKVDPFTMLPEEVILADIAHPLSQICRFNGHAAGHLSVARHSLNVHNWVYRHGGTPNEMFAGLLHDAAEAYIGDLVRPLKVRPEFEFFRQLDHYVTQVIFVRFELPFTELPEIVKEADREITNAEVNVARFDHIGNQMRDCQEFTDLALRHAYRIELDKGQKL